MRQLFQAIGRQTPAAIVFEDLHWADQSSLNLLEALLPLVTESPLYFVHVFRPLFEDTSDRIVAICRERLAEYHCELALERLDVELWTVAEVAHFQNVNTPEDWAGHAVE